MDTVKECLGDKGTQTIFQITSSKGVDMSAFTVWGSGVAQYLLPPGTVLWCTGVEQIGAAMVVFCEDDGGSCEMILHGMQHCIYREIC